jgi:hypothetical protein
LLILFYGDGRDVPGAVGRAYEATRDEVEQRAGKDFGRLRPWLARCKITTGERLAREIVRMNRLVVDRDA